MSDPATPHHFKYCKPCAVCRLPMDSDRPIHEAECDVCKGEFGQEPRTSYRNHALDIAAIVEVKQAAYGDSFSKSGEVLKLLYPNGVTPEQYGSMLTVVRVIDKLFRIATDKDALGENPWRDVAGYGLLEVARETK